MYKLKLYWSDFYDDFFVFPDWTAYINIFCDLRPFGSDDEFVCDCDRTGWVSLWNFSAF